MATLLSRPSPIALQPADVLLPYALARDFWDRYQLYLAKRSQVDVTIRSVLGDDGSTEFACHAAGAALRRR